MPKAYPPEFRRKVLDLLRAGRSVPQVAADLQISDQVIYNWRPQERIDTGQMPAVSSTNHAELVAARRRIAELETELAVTKRATVLLGLAGDERDRDVLLLLGALEDLTLYAVVALRRTQPDRDLAVFELAQRVDGCGRIHCVERLNRTADPEIKAWLLRDGFRNGVLDEYLAHLAAATGDLHTALLEPDVDDALLDGAGDILVALCAGWVVQPRTSASTQTGLPSFTATSTCSGTARRRWTGCALCCDSTGSWDRTTRRPWTGATQRSPPRARSPEHSPNSRHGAWSSRKP